MGEHSAIHWSFWPRAGSLSPISILAFFYQRKKNDFFSLLKHTLSCRVISPDSDSSTYSSVGVCMRVSYLPFRNSDHGKVCMFVHLYTCSYFPLLATLFKSWCALSILLRRLSLQGKCIHLQFISKKIKGREGGLCYTVSAVLLKVFCKMFLFFS